MSGEYRQRLLSIVDALAQPENAQRRAAVKAILEKFGVPYTVQQGEAVPERGQFVLFSRAPEEEKAVPVENIVVSFQPGQTPRRVLGAHYDTHEGSTGANDNASGAGVLLALAGELAQRGDAPAVDIVFFDGEETGRAGSKYYLSQLAEGAASAMVNLDVCGYGDTLCVRARKRVDALGPFLEKKRLAAHAGQAVCYLPESDDVTFTKGHVPALSVAMMPRWDTAIIASMRDYTGVFSALGLPPELRDQLARMEVMSTLHGGSRDKVSFLSQTALETVYDYLLDALYAPVKRRSLLQKLFP